MNLKERISMKNAIEINNLTKIYKDGKKALNNLSFSVRKGEIFSLLGPNGAGKSTLINILTTYLKPTDGNVKIFGEDLVEKSDSIRSKLSCIAQTNSIDGYLTLYENMKFQGRLYGVKNKELHNRIEELLTTFNLQEYRDKKVSNCSGGIQRRLDIAMSMMSIPKILFLDEPTTGMDIESRHAMWELIKVLNSKYKTTVFLTTHYLEEADKLSQTICIIKEGHEKIIGTSQELKHYLQQNLIRIYFDKITSDEINKIIYKLKSLEYVKGVRMLEDNLTIEVVDTQKDYTQILALGIDKILPFYRAEIVQPTLDDVFLAVANEEVSI